MYYGLPQTSTVYQVHINNDNFVAKFEVWQVAWALVNHIDLTPQAKKHSDDNDTQTGHPPVTERIAARMKTENFNSLLPPQAQVMITHQLHTQLTPELAQQYQESRQTSSIQISMAIIVHGFKYSLLLCLPQLLYA